MGSYYPTASLHMAMMDSRAREAERQAQDRSLLDQAARVRQRSRNLRRSARLRQLSLGLVSMGARLVQYGLPPYEPEVSRVAVTNS